MAAEASASQGQSGLLQVGSPHASITRRFTGLCSSGRAPKCCGAARSGHACPLAPSRVRPAATVSAAATRGDPAFAHRRPVRSAIVLGLARLLVVARRRAPPPMTTMSAASEVDRQDVREGQDRLPCSTYRSQARAEERALCRSGVRCCPMIRRAAVADARGAALRDVGRARRRPACPSRPGRSGNRVPSAAASPARSWPAAGQRARSPSLLRTSHDRGPPSPVEALTPILQSGGSARQLTDSAPGSRRRDRNRVAYRGSFVQ